MTVDAEDLEDGSRALPLDRHFAAALPLLLANCCDAETLAKAVAPRMPLQQVQMMQMMASRDPRILQALGISTGQLEAEMARHKKAQQARAMTPEAKRAADEASWRVWLRTYVQRLAMEREAGTRGAEAAAAQRLAAMGSANPRFVLRTWVLQNAIEHAEAGDYAEVQRLLELSRNPFAQGELPVPPRPLKLRVEPGFPLRYDGPPPKAASGICVTCSS